MAEFVHFRLEESLPELQLLEDYKLFSHEEIKSIIKRMRVFEYRLQRTTKTKKDFLKYIDYQLNVLKLIRKRRKRLLQLSGRNDIERAFARRIRGLYKQLIERYKSDVNLWLGFIEVCRNMNWQKSIGDLYASMLKFHSDKPHVWVEAAYWEYEGQDTMKVARNTLLKGLRFNKDSQLIYRKLFQLELINGDIELKATEREKLQKIKSHQDVNDVDITAVPVSIKLAESVYRNAVNTIKDVEFAVSFISSCEKYKFASSLLEFILKDLQERFSEDEFWRKTWATLPLRRIKNNQKSERECFNRFEDAVKCLPTEKMWSYYIEFCLSRLEKDRSQNRQKLIDSTLDVFSRAAQDHCHSPAHFQQWAKLACEEDDKLCTKILRYAIKRHSNVAVFWEQRLRLAIKNEVSNVKINKIIEKGLAKISPNEMLTFWKLAMFWRVTNQPDKVEPLFETGVITRGDIAAQIKVLYLSWTLTQSGLNAAWQLYKRIWSIPPISLQVFHKIKEIIEATPTPSIKKLRRVMRSAQSNFGKTNIDVWIESMDVERKYISVEESNAAAVYQQAVKTLEPLLVDQFIAYHTLQTTNGI